MAQGAKAAALPGVQGAGLPPQDPGAGGQTPSALRTPGNTIAPGDLYPIATPDKVLTKKKSIFIFNLYIHY